MPGEWFVREGNFFAEDLELVLKAACGCLLQGICMLREGSRPLLKPPLSVNWLRNFDMLIYSGTSHGIASRSVLLFFKHKQSANTALNLHFQLRYLIASRISAEDRGILQA